MTVDRVRAMVTLLRTDQLWRDPNPTRCQVTAIEHALQTATRARQHVPDDEQMIVAALLHDAARPWSDAHHGEVIAWMLRDRVRPEVFTALHDHGAYQHAILTDAPMPLGPPEALMLAAWDAASFDPDFLPDSFATFVSALEAVLA